MEHLMNILAAVYAYYSASRGGLGDATSNLQPDHQGLTPLRCLRI